MPWLSLLVSNILLALWLALAAWFVQRRLRWYGIAHILWMLVLVKLVTPPLVSVRLGDSPQSTPCQNGTCLCAQHQLTTASKTVPWVLLAVWSIGAGTTCWSAWCSWARFRRLMAHASPAPAEWQSLAAQLCTELSIRHRPEVLAVPGRLPPLVVPGWQRPRLLLPAALMGRLSGSQQVVLMLHELVHIQRRDHLVRLLELAVSVAYWWLPIVRLIGRQLRTCEETCCDAAVVSRQPQARHDYARLLLDVLDFVVPVPRSVEQVTAMSSADDLERRLRAILDVTPRKQRRRPFGALAVGVACGIVPCELHYDWSRPLPPVTTAIEQEPATGTTRSSNGRSDGDLRFT